MAEERKPIRCVVYTRKSSEEGLEQAFNSLDAQREAGLAYIASQKHEGWVLVPTQYDDGGYSGGSTDRPALQQLLADIHAGKVDVIVVYKVDRLSRSLGDFAQMMTLFDKHQVSFVSVTQQFNTTSSMGRLTLNILLSFAQFEREVTGERIRDKFAASKKKGMWMGGNPPLGYNVCDRQLVVVPEEAALVRRIFQLYLETHSLLRMMQILREEGHTQKRWQTAEGNWRGGGKFTIKSLNKILRNVRYQGRVPHGKENYPGQHDAIVEDTLWNAVHDTIRHQQSGERQRWHCEFLLRGKMKTHEGYHITSSTARKSKIVGKQASTQRFRYYVSSKALEEGYKTCPIKTLNAERLEAVVVGHLLNYLYLYCAVVFHFIQRLVDDSEQEYFLRQLIDGIIVRPDRLDITLSKAALAELDTTAQLQPGEDAVPPPAICHQPDIVEEEKLVTLLLPINFKRSCGKHWIVSRDGKDLVLPAQPKPEPILVQAIGRGFVWKQMLEASPGLTIKQLAVQCGYTDRYVSRHLGLTGLAPDIVHQALSGTLPSMINLQVLEEASAFLSWKRQRHHLSLQ